MELILTPTGTQGRSIRLDTREGNAITNCQDPYISAFQQSQFPDIVSRFPTAIFRSEPSSIYNCHGLTFASRRTGIYDIMEIHKILKDDDYVEVQYNKVLPGDIVLYFTSEGDIEHSGVVIAAPDEEPLKIAKIYSKWGCFGEAIHYVNDCRYDPSNLKYYRIKK